MFLRKNIVAVSFFQNCAIHSYSFLLILSFPLIEIIQALNIFSINIYASPVKNKHVISTAQTDLGLRSRTFSLKINKLPTFSEINQGWQC